MSFVVLASGVGRLEFEWFRNGVSISETPTFSLVLADITQLHAGEYWVRVRDDSGESVESEHANLNVPGAMSNDPFSGRIHLAGPSVTLQATTVLDGREANPWYSRFGQYFFEFGRKLAPFTSRNLSRRKKLRKFVRFSDSLRILLQRLILALGQVWAIADKTETESQASHRKMKKGIVYDLLDQREVSGDIIYDEEIMLKNNTHARRVRAWVEVDGKRREMTFLTNNLEWKRRAFANSTRHGGRYGRSSWSTYCCDSSAERASVRNPTI